MARKLTVAEARAALEEHGGIRPATRALGVSRSTFRYWLDPEAGRERQHRYYIADREKRLAKIREHYHSRSALQHARHRLQQRRSRALQRMAERNQRRQEEAN